MGKCPFLQKMCMFAGKHKAFAFGGLMAHVQPMKFALGRCWKHGGKNEDPDHKMHMVELMQRKVGGLLSAFGIELPKQLNYHHHDDGTFHSHEHGSEEHEHHKKDMDHKGHHHEHHHGHGHHHGPHHHGHHGPHGHHGHHDWDVETMKKKLAWFEEQKKLPVEKRFREMTDEQVEKRIEWIKRKIEHPNEDMELEGHHHMEGQHPHPILARMHHMIGNLFHMGHHIEHEEPMDGESQEMKEPVVHFKRGFFRGPH